MNSEPNEYCAQCGGYHPLTTGGCNGKFFKPNDQPKLTAADFIIEPDLGKIVVRGVGRDLYTFDAQRLAHLISVGFDVERKDTEQVAKIERLAKALLKYGSHFDNCEYFTAKKPRECTCGYEAEISGDKKP